MYQICLDETANAYPQEMDQHMIWTIMQVNLSLGFANNKGRDQPARPCSLIGTFVIYVESIISKLATS